MSLQLDIYVLWTKDAHHALYCTHSFVISPTHERFGERTVFAAGKTNQSTSVLFQFFYPSCAFFFLCTQFCAGNEPAKILIPQRRFDQQGIAHRTSFAEESVIDGDFRADMSANVELLSRQMKSRCS